ncbi:MAG: helix-turn-helix transcriptional regulator [Acidimicrobiia bacterium]
MSDPTARALSLLSLLQTHRHWAGSELAARLGVSERTVRRDVERLRELGYPVLAAPGVDGGYQLAAGAHVPPLVVDDDEAVALAVGLRAAAGAAIDGIEETTVRVLAKLDQILPDRLRRRVDALTSNVEVLRWAPRDHVPATSLTTLAQACRDSEEVRFEYTRRDGESARRLVQPHQLVSVGQRWYLVAWDIRRADWRTFRVDRMEEPALAGARFERRELPAESAAEFVAAGLRSASQQFEAVVRVDGDPERVAAMSHWFGGQMTPLDGDTTRMRIGADALEWMASMIAILATSFDVAVEDAPPVVYDLLADAGRRLRFQYVPGTN